MLPVCGDGIVAGSEVCDDGNAVNTDACNNSCNLNTPNCNQFNFSISPTSGVAPLATTATFTNVNGFTVNTLDRGDATTVSTPTTSEAHSYTTAGSYTGSITISNDLDNSLTAVCTQTMTISPPPIDGVCG